MAKSYLKYYRKGYQPQALFRLTLDTLFTANQRQKIALKNRQQDYLKLQQNPEWLALHGDLTAILEEGQLSWNSYDYGEGYFYQSCPQVGITGFRDTAGRVKAMDLTTLLEGKNVLEIGCNTGFLSLSIAPSVKSVTGFDIAPHLIQVAKRTAQFLKIENATFSVSSFEAFETTQAYDAVLSFANHSTYDGNTQYELEAFFDRCYSLTLPGGLFLFESHPPALEGENLDKVCQLIADRFHIQSREVLQYNNLFLDQGRTFIVAQRTESTN